MQRELKKAHAAAKLRDEARAVAEASFRAPPWPGPLRGVCGHAQLQAARK